MKTNCCGVQSVHKTKLKSWIFTAPYYAMLGPVCNAVMIIV